MSTLRKIEANMSTEFFESFEKAAVTFGLTTRQLAAVCLSFGLKAFTVFGASDHGLSMSPDLRRFNFKSVATTKFPPEPPVTTKNGQERDVGQGREAPELTS